MPDYNLFASFCFYLSAHSITETHHRGNKRYIVPRGLNSGQRHGSRRIHRYASRMRNCRWAIMYPGETPHVASCITHELGAAVWIFFKGLRESVQGNAFAVAAGAYHLIHLCFCPYFGTALKLYTGVNIEKASCARAQRVRGSRMSRTARGKSMVDRLEYVQTIRYRPSPSIPPRSRDYGLHRETDAKGAPELPDLREICSRHAEVVR